jgi:cbb3-type cytochrome oxidase subunit 3
MSRSGLYALVAVLVVVLIGVGYYAYQQSQRPAFEVKVDNNGLKINGNAG